MSPTPIRPSLVPYLSYKCLRIIFQTQMFAEKLHSWCSRTRNRSRWWRRCRQQSRTGIIIVNDNDVDNIVTKIRTHLARQLQGRGTTPPAMIPEEAQRGAEVGGWAEESEATRANISQGVTIVTMLSSGCSVECFQEYSNAIKNEKCATRLFAKIQS